MAEGAGEPAAGDGAAGQGGRRPGVVSADVLPRAERDDHADDQPCGPGAGAPWDAWCAHGRRAGAGSLVRRSIVGGRNGLVLVWVATTLRAAVRSADNVDGLGFLMYVTSFYTFSSHCHRAISAMLAWSYSLSIVLHITV